MKKRIWAFSIPAVILLAVFLVPSLLTSQSAVMDKPSKEDVAHKMQSIQIPFVANNGQVDAQVKYYANTFGGTVFVTKEGEIVYALPNNSSELGVESLKSDSRRQRPEARRQMSENRCKKSESNPKSPIQNLSSTSIGNLKSGVAIKETLVGGRVHDITGNEKAVTNVSYFKGNDPSQWKTNISTYDVVSLGEIYKGIELKLKAYGNNVEKLFCVKPDANPEQIKISLSGIQPPESPFIKGDGINNSSYKGGTDEKSPLEKGARGLWVNEHGELVAETELGAVKFTKPVAYQEINGKRVDVECKYTIADCGMKNAECKTNLKSEIRNLSSTSIGDPQLEYGFKVASYDKTKDLIIDPLLASTFLGGFYSGRVGPIVINSSGNIYVAGFTSDGNSSDFPTTTNAYDTSLNGNYDVFVSKLNEDLTNLIASTYLGGSAYEYSLSMAIDPDGNLYVTGKTESSDFPITSDAYNTSHKAGAFVSKLSGDLTSLLASTYLGYGDSYSIAIDSGGNIYVTGQTESLNFPTTTGGYGGGRMDVFITKLSGDLASLLASTYLGGSGYDIGSAIAIDSGGNIYLAGSTFDESSDFPTTTDAYDTSYNGSSPY